jgi:putative phage-type endonuclease
MNAQAKEKEEIVPGTPEWHKRRRGGFGGSDAAAVVGMSRYRNLVDLVLEKRGLSQQPTNDAMRRGKLVEKGIRQALALITKGIVFGEEFVTHPEHEFMFATLDGRYANGKPFQIKTHADYPATRAQYGASGTDQFPDEERLQIVHEMACASVEEEDLVVLLADDGALEVLSYMVDQGVNIDIVAYYIVALGLRTYTVRRDRELEAELIEAERDAYERYIKGTETPIDISKAQPDDKIIDADAEAEKIAAALKPAWLARQTADAVYELEKARMQSAIGLSAGIVTRMGQITWKKNRDSESEATDWEAAFRQAVEQASLSEMERLTIIRANTRFVVKEGPRVFRVPAAWRKEL